MWCTYKSYKAKLCSRFVSMHLQIEDLWLNALYLFWMHRSPLWCTYVQVPVQRSDTKFENFVMHLQILQSKALFKICIDALTNLTKQSFVQDLYRCTYVQSAIVLLKQNKHFFKLAHKGPLWCTCTYVHHVQVPVLTIVLSGAIQTLKGLWCTYKSSYLAFCETLL